MGEEVGRIEKEYILTNLSEQRLDIDIHTTTSTIRGILADIDSSELSIECEEKDLEKVKEKEYVRVYFGYFGHTMTFETKIKKVANPLKLEYPKGLVKNLERKFERIPSPEGLSLSFMYEDVMVELEFPKTEDYREVNEPLVSEYFDEGSIEGLIAQFREKAREFSDLSGIKMLRGKEPSTFEEQCIVETGKSIFLPKTANGFPEKESLEGRSVISRDMFPDPTESDSLRCGKNLHTAQRYVKQKAEKGISSEIYCPVVYQNYVVGYVYLANRSGESAPFSLKTLDFAVEFSYILAFTLKKHGYFSSEKKAVKEFYPEIVNVSGSGVLFAYPSGELTAAIGVYTDLELYFHINKRKIKIGSRVMRKYEAGGHVFFGVQFLEMEPEDFRFLFDYVYGRPYTDSDDRLWEGGAAPPQLDL
ncbi:MAG: PilZ domain-containing protein [Spirochaetaceae bacterium]